jgi:hypothetical protein
LTHLQAKLVGNKLKVTAILLLSIILTLLKGGIVVTGDLICTFVYEFHAFGEDTAEAVAYIYYDDPTLGMFKISSVALILIPLQPCSPSHTLLSQRNLLQSLAPKSIAIWILFSSALMFHTLMPTH